MLFGYPHASSEVRNLDWILRKVEELDKKVNDILAGAITDMIDRYFNSIMIDAIYDEDTETIELKKELMVGDGLHIFNADNNSMTIDG